MDRYVHTLTSEVHILPFLKYKKKESGVHVQYMGEKPAELKAAADLIKAIESKDENAVADALKAAFDCYEKEPHEEGPHTNSEEVE